jgi:signal transduction histidine kinase
MTARLPKELLHSRRVWFLALLPGICFTLGALSVSAGQESLPTHPTPVAIKNVLVLYPDNRFFPSQTLIDRTFHADLLTTGQPLEIFTEDMERMRLGDSSYDALMSSYYRQKYRNVKLDVVIAVGGSTLQFVLAHRSDVFQGTPIVFCLVSTEDPQVRALPPNVTGILLDVDLGKTLEAALQLQPKTRQVVVMSGVSAGDVWVKSVASRQLEKYQNQVQIEYWDGLTVEEAKVKLGNVSPQTVVLYLSAHADHTGRTFSGQDFLEAIAPTSQSPIYSFISVLLGSGAVGGHMVDEQEGASRASRLVKEILQGSTFPVHPEVMECVYMFDWRELRRWKIPESRVPEGAVIEFRPPSLWKTHRALVIIVSAAGLVLTLLVVFLLVERRRKKRSQEQLAERFRFEMLLSQVSSTFAKQDVAKVDEEISFCLRQVKEFFKADRVSIWRLNEEDTTFLRTHSWPDVALPPLPVNPPDRFQDTVRRLLNSEEIRYSNPEERRKLADGEAFGMLGICALLAFPLKIGRRVTGALFVACLRGEKVWPDELVARLHTVGEIIANALTRRESEEAVATEQELNTAMLESLPGLALLIGAEGEVLRTNRDVGFASVDQVYTAFAEMKVGANYLECWRRLRTHIGVYDPTADAIELVVGGAHEKGTLEILLPQYGDQWIEIRAIRLKQQREGSLVVHLDITQRKNAELERSETLEEIAHLNRVASMGQMAASLAHELAQPLAAILSNAQAAERFASCSEPDLSEIRGALADITHDNNRAREVIQNLRSLLKKSKITPREVDLNQIVNDASLLIKNDALLRGVRLRFVLSSQPVQVQGEVVPLQQVILNLINNGMDAMRDLPVEKRVITIRTIVEKEKGHGKVVVEDCGPGIPKNKKLKLFQPFFTTKGSGLGVGLSICKSIVESLGGRISLERAEPGAAFQVELQLVAVQDTASRTAISENPSKIPFVA